MVTPFDMSLPESTATTPHAAPTGIDWGKVLKTISALSGSGQQKTPFAPLPGQGDVAQQGTVQVYQLPQAQPIAKQGGQSDSADIAEFEQYAKIFASIFGGG